MKKEIRITGKKNSGKTTLIENLSRELKSRGFRVAAVKHTSHNHQFDSPGTDSWRYKQAGCETAVIISPENFVCHADSIDIKKRDKLYELLFGDIDILFYEGRGEGTFPTIECVGRDGDAIIREAPELIAVVSENPVDTVLPVFKLKQVREIADFLIRQFGLPKP